jgi:uncharacterized protein (DUF488 family)
MPHAHTLRLPSQPLKRQLENRATWNDSRSADEATFFTFGYTGRKTRDILAALLIHDVRTVIDVRQNPVSMYRPEMSKSNIARLVNEYGMFYAHVPQLGVPRDIRAKAIDEGDRQVIWDWYDEFVIPQFFGKNLHSFLNCFEHPVALMCVEIDPCECHRHRLSHALEHLGLRGFEL